MALFLGRISISTRRKLASILLAVVIFALLAALVSLAHGRPGIYAVVDAVRISYDTWVAAGWTLGRALRTARFWWVPIGYFGALFAWYAVQVHHTKHLIDLKFSPQTAAWALGMVSLVAGARTDRARPCV
jgi:hypothetical protein